MKKGIFFVSLFVAALYIGGFVFLVATQDEQVYRAPARTNEACGERIGEQRVQLDNTTLYHRHRKDADRVVVFYHGNGNIVCDLVFLMNLFNEEKISYIFPEYTGYSNDGRRASHAGVQRNVRETVDYIQTQGYVHVFVIGQSIGSGAASYHAQLQSPEQLFLISPFTQLEAVVQPILPMYPQLLVAQAFDDQFDNMVRLQDYRGSLIILHGTADRVVPFAQGRALFDASESAPKTFIPLEGYGHADLFKAEETLDALRGFVRESR